MKRVLGSLLLSLAVLLVASSAWAQAGAPPSDLELLLGNAPAQDGSGPSDLDLLLGGAPVSMVESHAAAQMFHRVDGGWLEVALVLDVDEGWHLYHHVLGGEPGKPGVGTALAIELEAPGVSFGGVRYPPPEVLDQSILPNASWVYVHHGRFVLRATGELGVDARPEQLRVHLDGLTCEESGACVLYEERLASSGPGEDAFFDDAANRLEEPGASTAGEAGAADTLMGFSPVGGELGDRGLMTWLLLAFVAGALLNVMPCVLPVISIKVLSFVQQAGEDKKRVLHLGLAFAAGIVVVFMALAAAAATVGAAWGEQFQSEAFQVAMIAIVFAFSLSLFGVFELGVPTGVGALAGGYREGLGDAFFKGMLATALATPCSGPFLGSTLTWTLSQSSVTIFAVFLSLGLGMALPYVVLTANPGLLKKLPKPGAWMDTFKHVMGFVLLATVLYLLWILRSDRLLYVIFFLLPVSVACWWWGRFATYEKTRTVRNLHLLVAVAILFGGHHATLRWLPAHLQSDDSLWQEYSPSGLQLALADGRTVLLDFTADWCPNCLYNEAFVYESEDVLEAAARKDVLFLKADITDDTEETRSIEEFMAGLGSRSIPFMAIFPADDPGRPRVFRDIVSKEEVLTVLDAVPTP